MSLISIVFGISFLSGLVRSIIGFATGTATLAFLSLFVPFDQAMLVSAFLNMVNNGIVWLLYRHAFDWDIALWFGSAAILSSLIGAYLFVFVHPHHMSLIVGTALIIYAVLMLWEPKTVLLKLQEILSHLVR